MLVVVGGFGFWQFFGVCLCFGCLLIAGWYLFKVFFNSMGGVESS
jgi:hypothetical protein